MTRWVRLFAPVLALAVVLAAGYAALGRNAAYAQVSTGSAPAAVKPAVVRAPQAQATSAPAPTTAPLTPTEAADTEHQDGATEAAGSETADAAEPADTADATTDAAEAAALASKATVTVDQAKATVLAANAGATIVKAELHDENGSVVYSVELNNGDEVKVDAQSGAIIGVDKAGSEGSQDGETNDDAVTAAPAK